MAETVILADTSLLIDFFRKTDKKNAQLFALVHQGYTFKVSAITIYEIYAGATLAQHQFWTDFLQKIETLPLDEHTASAAVRINNELKRKRKQIELADLFIAATAVANNLPLATLNLKHFNRVDGLQLI